jgi:ribosomal protein L37E
MNEEKKKEIISALKARQVTLPCPRCGNKVFTLLDGYINTSIQSDFQSFNLGGPSIPSVATACDRCGFVSVHALGVLGLLPKDGGEQNNG